ncbi:hypothetical protein [Microbacterium maritypicum]
MIRNKRLTLAMSAMALSALGVATLTVPAVADDSTSQDTTTPEQVSALVADAATSAGVPAADFTSEAPVSVMVPESASEGIGVHGVDGSGFIVSVPVGVSVADGVTAGDGSTVYAGTDGHPDITVTPLESGVRISTVLWDDSQSTSFGYPLPEGVEGEIQSDGSVILTRALEMDNGSAPTDADVIVGQIEPAWAVDANGKAVPTTYVLADGMLTQKVDTTDAAFPVVADPTWGFTGPLQIRARWTRAETATIANGGWGATGLTAVCAAAGGAMGGPPIAAIFGAGCLATGGPAIYTAGVAQNSNPKRCLEGFLTYVPGVSVVVPWYGTYACK